MAGYRKGCTCERWFVYFSEWLEHYFVLLNCRINIAVLVLETLKRQMCHHEAGSTAGTANTVELEHDAWGCPFVFFVFETEINRLPDVY